MSKTTEKLGGLTVVTEVKDDGTIIQTAQTKSAVDEIFESLSASNMVGYTRGIKTKNGVPTGQEAIIFWVKKKIPKAELKPDEVIPQTIVGELTDVVEKEEIVALGKRKAKTPVVTARSLTKRIRPAPANVSDGEETITAATGGFIGTRDGATGMFNNSHGCLKTIRKDLSLQRPLRMFQPGRVDGGTPEANYYADTATAVVMPEGQPAFNDCGFCPENAPGMIGDYGELMKVYTGYTLPVGVATLAVGDKVFKIGRTTEYTEGTVISLDATVNVGYGTDGTVTHKACIIFSDFSDGGDSGSAIYKMIDGKPYLVAYLFAGSSQNTIGHEIQNALTILRVTPRFASAPAVNYTITGVSGPNGSISPSGSIVKGEGESQTFTATPNAGYSVGDWSLDAMFSQEGGESYMLKDIKSNHNVSVSFKPIPAKKYALTGGGRIAGIFGYTFEGTLQEV